jgi:hypothetical protein
VSPIVLVLAGLVLATSLACHGPAAPTSQMAEGVAGNGPGAGARLAPAAITAGCLSV